MKSRPNRAPSIVLPPSPAIPQSIQPAFPPYIKTFETDPETLRPGVIHDLTAVAAGWSLEPEESESQQPTPQATQNPSTDLLTTGAPPRPVVDVLELLKTTTRAVRSVRNYLVSLPDDSAVGQGTRASYRPQTLSSAPLPRRQVSQPNSSHDPLTRVRGRALEVLAVLRELEERARLPLEHDAYDAQSDHGSSAGDGGGSSVGRAASPPSRGTSPASHLEEPDFLDADTSVSISFVDVGAGGARARQVPVWDDESSYDFNSMTEEEKRERWDERLVVGGGWLYRQDMRMEELRRERDVVGKYIDSVDDVLFGGFKDGKRGWEHEHERLERKERMEREARAKGRRVSAGDAMGGLEGSARAKRRVVSTGLLEGMRGMAVTEEPEEMESLREEEEEEAVDDDDLPPWAKRTTFADDDYGECLFQPFVVFT